jgi:hypothetical protein
MEKKPGAWHQASPWHKDKLHPWPEEAAHMHNSFPTSPTLLKIKDIYFLLPHYIEKGLEVALRNNEGHEMSFLN